MDFMLDKEFHKLFDRVSKFVDLQGAGPPREINERLRQKINEYRYLPRRSQLAVFFERSRMPNLKKLIFAGFSRRSIDEAISKPNGKVSLTLRFGRKKAHRILRARVRKRLGL